MTEVYLDAGLLSPMSSVPGMKLGPRLMLAVNDEFCCIET